MKTFCTLSLILISYAASSQVEKGTIFVGTSSNLSLLSTSTGGNSDISFDIYGKIGYFFIDNLVGGVDLGYGRLGNSNSFTLGLFSRYYIAGKYFLGAGYSNTNYKSSGNSVDVGLLIFEGGYAAFLTKNIAIEPALVYTRFTGDVAGNSSNFGLRVGFSLYFNRK
jgi:hypothetical protein